MSWYDMTSWLDSGDDPSKDAMGYLDQIPDMIKPYYQPYMDAGNKALPTLQQQYEMLINDPTAMMTQIGQGYTASPGYQYNVNQATNAANNAAAAGGMLGSPAEQQNMAQDISGIASQDYNTYMNQALGQYGVGLTGEEGINQMGYKANTGYANELADVQNSKANLSYAGGANQNMARNSRFNTMAQLGSYAAFM